jgi:hypothetical protein
MNTLERIRELNDDARHYLTDGKIVLSRGIRLLPEDDQAGIIERVCSFDEFTPENDPWGEHDFGRFEHSGEHIIWKLDYLDQDELYGSPDPADVALTKRVLTIMLAGEY